jgi:hypothetical protein
LVDVWKCCLCCEVKKVKCECPSAECEKALHAEVTLKKSKVSAPVQKRKTRGKKSPTKAPAHPQSQAPPWSRATTHPDTRAVSKKCAQLQPPPLSSDEDAEGDEDLEVGMASNSKGEVAAEVEQLQQGELFFAPLVFTRLTSDRNTS